MASFASNTFEGPFGQAHQVPQLASAPFTPYNEPAFKPVPGATRYVGLEGGSFFDAIVRGFFGYHPDMIWTAGATQASLDAALFDPSADRGFEGTLANLRTPHGDATVTSGKQGLSIRLS